MRPLALLYAALLVTPAAFQSAGSVQVAVVGAGSSLAANLYTAAAQAYALEQPTVSVTYTSLSSGQGICRIEDATTCASGDTTPPLAIDFAGSDAILTQTDYSSYPDLQMYPTVASAVVPVVNLGGPGGLVLSTLALAQIFRGVITTWDDPAILKLNPSWKPPPGQPIMVAVRSDSSGTTQIFKTALAAFDPLFASQIGTSSAPMWPNVTTHGQSGTQGIVTYVQKTPYAIGYCGLGSAVQAGLMQALLMKSNNAVVAASVDSILAAMAQFGTSSFGNNGDSPSHLTADLENAGGNAWPIVGYTYLVMRKNTLRSGATCENVRVTVAFWYWFWTSSTVATIIRQQGFGALSSDVQSTVVSSFIAGIKCMGSVVQLPPPAPDSSVAVLLAFAQAQYNILSLTVNMFLGATAQDRAKTEAAIVTTEVFQGAICFIKFIVAQPNIFIPLIQGTSTTDTGLVNAYVATSFEVLSFGADCTKAIATTFPLTAAGFAQWGIVFDTTLIYVFAVNFERMGQNGVDVNSEPLSFVVTLRNAVLNLVLLTYNESFPGGVKAALEGASVTTLNSTSFTITFGHTSVVAGTVTNTTNTTTTSSGGGGSNNDGLYGLLALLALIPLALLAGLGVWWYLQQQPAAEPMYFLQEEDYVPEYYPYPSGAPSPMGWYDSVYAVDQPSVMMMPTEALSAYPMEPTLMGTPGGGLMEGYYPPASSLVLPSYAYPSYGAGYA